MKYMLWPGILGYALFVGIGAWGLGWVLQAWLGVEMLLALTNGVFGCG